MGEREQGKSTLKAVLGSKERREAGAAGYGNILECFCGAPQSVWKAREVASDIIQLIHSHLNTLMQAKALKRYAMLGGCRRPHSPTGETHGMYVPENRLSSKLGTV